MDRLIQLVDKYLVPIYRKDGVIPVLIIVFGLVLFFFLAVYLGIDNLVMEWLK